MVNYALKVYHMQQSNYNFYVSHIMLFYLKKKRQYIFRLLLAKKLLNKVSNWRTEIKNRKYILKALWIEIFFLTKYTFRFAFLEYKNTDFIIKQ